MTPAARVQAAIELLDEIENGPAAADRTVAAFFKARRYAGAKDRGAITDLVYAVLRRQGELRWRLHRPPDGRALVMAQLTLANGDPAAAPEALFTGERYAPAPLAAEERGLLDRLRSERDAEPPAAARANIPDWLWPDLTRHFGADVEQECRALNARAPVDLRVNTLKTTREAVLKRLADDGIDAVPGTWSPLCVRLAGRPALAAHPLLRDGHVEPQDEGSQLVALLTAAERQQQVVDLCAGAGGKSLALAADMANTGQVYALDADRRRLQRLTPRLQRAGARNLQMRALRGLDDPWLTELQGRADRVLVDAPCSGTGAWRRRPEARWRFDRAALEADVGKQAALLDAAAALTRPGGRLIYATCSVLMRENEEQVAAFLARRPEFELMSAAEVWRRTIGDNVPDDEDMIVLTPHRHGTDGFFVAIMSRNGSAKDGRTGLDESAASD